LTNRTRITSNTITRIRRTSCKPAKNSETSEKERRRKANLQYTHCREGKERMNTTKADLFLSKKKKKRRRKRKLCLRQKWKSQSMNRKKRN
jgi:hypothetical protein